MVLEFHILGIALMGEFVSIGAEVERRSCYLILESALCLQKVLIKGGEDQVSGEFFGCGHVE